MRPGRRRRQWCPTRQTSSPIGGPGCQEWQCVAWAAMGTCARMEQGGGEGREAKEGKVEADPDPHTRCCRTCQLRLAVTQRRHVGPSHAAPAFHLPVQCSAGMWVLPKQRTRAGRAMGAPARTRLAGVATPVCSGPCAQWRAVQVLEGAGAAGLKAPHAQLLVGLAGLAFANVAKAPVCVRAHQVGRAARSSMDVGWR